MDLLRRNPRGIKHVGVPGDNYQFVCGVIIGGLDVVELNVQAFHTRWHVQMEGISVEQIAPPRQNLAVGRELEPSHVTLWATGRMRTGNPFGVINR